MKRVKIEKNTKNNVTTTYIFYDADEYNAEIEPELEPFEKNESLMQRLERSKDSILKLFMAGALIFGGAAKAIDVAHNSWRVVLDGVVSGDTLRIENVGSGTEKTVKICGIEAPTEADRDSLKELLAAKRGRLRIGFIENPIGEEEVILQVRTREEGGIGEYENAVDRLDRKGRLSRIEEDAFSEPIVFGQDREYYSDVCLDRGSSLHIRNDSRGFWEGWNWTQAELYPPNKNGAIPPYRRRSQPTCSSGYGCPQTHTYRGKWQKLNVYL